MDHWWFTWTTLRITTLKQLFSTWGRSDSWRGRVPFLGMSRVDILWGPRVDILWGGSRVDNLYTQLCYIYFIRSSDGGRCVTISNARFARKHETSCCPPRQRSWADSTRAKFRSLVLAVSLQNACLDSKASVHFSTPLRTCHESAQELRQVRKVLASNREKPHGG